MESTYQELLKVCKYQKKIIETLQSVCDSCKAHTIHEHVQMEKINSIIQKAESEINIQSKIRQ